jgi:hypothetical protein
MTKKKILKIIGVILLLLLLAAIILIVTLYRDPGLYLRVVSEKLVEDQTVEASYNYDFDDTSRIKTVPYFYFKPSESGKYTFSAAGLESSDEVRITMTVTDRYLDDYFVADNRRRRSKNEQKDSDSISGSTDLQAEQPCYVLFSVEPCDEDLAQFSGSFKLTVTRDPEDEGPPQLTMEESVTINVGAEGQACAAFVPPETGYYRFEHSIVSRDSSKGYSSISSIKSTDKIKVGLTDNICSLIKGKEYLVWVAANETGTKRSTIELSCQPLKTETAGGICSLEIDEGSVIEYVAKKDCIVAVYTISEGDPKLLIYEKAGLPLRTDDKSEASLSDNPDGIAAVLRVKEGTGLHICIYGDVKDCRVFITEYTGDGTTLTMEDLVPIPENEKADEEVNEETDEETDEETAEEIMEEGQ